MTEQELKDVTLIVIQQIYLYSYQGKTLEQCWENCQRALQEFRNDMEYIRLHPDKNSKLLVDIANCIEEVGRENGYWE